MSASSPVTWDTFGPDAVVARVSDPSSAQALATHLRANGFTDVVPGQDTVIVVVDPTTPAPGVRALPRTYPTPAATPGPVVSIPVHYDGADLDAVADRAGLSRTEVIAVHSGAVYTVDFLGFAPGFPYLSGLDARLADVPRLDQPRTRIPAGSVGLAAGRTCIYPAASPGGWQLLGHTDVSLFNPEDPTAPALLAPGTRVRFIDVDGGTAC